MGDKGFDTGRPHVGVHEFLWIFAVSGRCPWAPGRLALLADQLANRNVHALQTRAAGIQCLKALLADQLAIRSDDVLQTRAASIRCLKALLSDQLAIRNVHVLQTRGAGINQMPEGPPR